MIHALLQRQLKRLGLSEESLPTPEAWAALLTRVSRAYEDADQERYTLERNLALSSEEMGQLYDELKHQSDTLLLEERGKLAASEDRYRAVMETVQEVIFQTDAEGRWVYLNPAWEAITGFPVGGSLGQPALAFVLEEDRAQAMGALKQAVRRPGQDARHSLRFRAADGFRWLEVHARFLLDAEGRPAGITGTLNDITERRRSEEGLRQQQAFMTAVLDTLPVSIFLKDAAGRFLFVNQETCRHQGRPAQAMVGEVDEGLYPPEVEQEMRAHDQAAWADGGMHIREQHVPGPGGGRWLLTGKTLVRRESAAEPMLLCFSLDITDRRRAEEALRRRDQELEDAIECLEAGFAMFDSRDRLVTCNTTYREMYPEMGPALQAGTPYLDILREYTRAGGHEATGLCASDWIATRLSSHRTPQPAEDRRVADRWIRASDRRTKNGGTVSLRTDITALKEQQEEYRRAKEAAEAATVAKSEFLANMSHEIRTPMNGILGMTGFLLDTGLDPEQREHAETIHGCAHSLLDIINDILDFSKIEAGKLDLEILPFDPRECLDDVLALFAERAAAKGLDLACRVDPEVPALLMGDSGRLRQILVNLAGNAVKFTASGSVVMDLKLASAGPEGVALAFEVTDTGIGIPEEGLNRLFQSFSQADGSMARRFGGTGLGLAICRQLVGLMGGQIGVRSTLGVGSTFAFTARFGQVEPAAGPPAPYRGRPRVVWVGSATATREAVLGQLTAAGFRPSTLEPGQPLALDPPPELVVLELPEGTPAPRLPREVPCLQLVPWGTRGAETPGTQVLQKPVRLKSLAQAVEVALGHAPSVPPAESAGVGGAAPVGLRRGRVLVAEDNPVNQRVAQRHLERQGFRVDLAADGLEALEACQRLPYDLVFMDCQMPGMDGFEATAAIRRLEAQKAMGRLPIVALTAHAMVGERDRCLAAGMDDYLTKPLQLDELTRVLHHWLQESPMTPSPEGPASSPAPEQPLLDGPTLQGLLDLDDGATGLLSEMVAIFRDDTPRRIQDILEALDKGDADELSRAAHALKGGSGALGAKALRVLAADLEALGRAGSLEVGPDPKGRLETLFADTLQALGDFVAARS